ncbi:monovalent cation/H(+) antiporter subunit G [Rothia sp. LK2588]|uniref:monovalent cation/H(+) antiporter subunit G n=1 Tax=Rothia sp. LK2588 TaxID=3114369 RepID=UPI0034CF2F1A
METLTNVLTAACLLLGCIMSLGAAIGLIRFPDLLSRLHAGTKPQVFGLTLLLLGVGFAARDWAIWPLLLVILLLQLLTIPISAHMMGRSGYRNKHFRSADLAQDDLRTVIESAESGK